MKRTIIIALSTILLLAGCEDNSYKTFDSNPYTNFDALWETLDQKYCYFETKNLDWDGVKTIYRAKLTHVKTAFDLFDVCAQMLDTLQDGHVNLYSSFDISRCTGWFDNYPANYNETVVYGAHYLGSDYRIAGGFHYGLINNGEIGYIRYRDFSNGFTSANFSYMDYYFKDCKGIIIDVRNNGGGQLDYSKNFASCFFTEKTITGYMRHKTGFGHTDFSEMQPMYVDPALAPIDWSKRKVVVLCNRRCYSATNDFVVKMLQAPNVTVIGGKTGGGGGMPLSSELPNGWMIRFSAVPMYDQNGSEIEFGVNPDIQINTTDEDATTGKDTIIEYAINLLKNN